MLDLYLHTSSKGSSLCAGHQIVECLLKFACLRRICQTHSLSRTLALSTPPALLAPSPPRFIQVYLLSPSRTFVAICHFPFPFPFPFPFQPPSLPPSLPRALARPGSSLYSLTLAFFLFKVNEARDTNSLYTRRSFN
jgi:hypothetical protein